MASRDHPDFSAPWIRQALTSPDVYILRNAPGDPKGKPSPGVANSLFARTLATDSAIRAQVFFIRPSTADDVVPDKTGQKVEQCAFFSVGDGVDGKLGRAHGGFSSLVLDHVLGRTASVSGEVVAPATATMTVDYKAPVDTPGVILVRGWPTSVEGRKLWVKGRIENREGRVLAEGKALFIAPKPVKI
jgi:acyl-coenzyme A thioesterase PaaI-like protein